MKVSSCIASGNKKQVICRLPTTEKTLENGNLMSISQSRAPQRGQTCRQMTADCLSRKIRGDRWTFVGYFYKGRNLEDASSQKTGQHHPRLAKRRQASSGQSTQSTV